MARTQKILMAMVLAIGLSVLVRPIIPIVQVVQAQNVNCSGSFTPSFNCIITGLWLFQNGYTTSGGLLYNTAAVTLTNGQVLALNTTPFTIIPLSKIPAGYIAVVTYGTATFNYTTAYGAGSDLKLYYTSRYAGNAASGTITFAGFLDQSASNNSVFTGTIAGVEPGKTPKAVVLEQTLSTAMSGGAAANRVTIFVQYVLMPVGALN